MTNREWLSRMNDDDLAERIIGIKTAVCESRIYYNCNDEKYDKMCKDVLKTWLSSGHKNDVN